MSKTISMAKRILLKPARFTLSELEYGFQLRAPGTAE